MFERLEKRRLLTSTAVLAFQAQTVEINDDFDRYVFANINNDDQADLVTNGKVFFGSGDNQYAAPKSLGAASQGKPVAVNIDADEQDELLFLRVGEIGIVDVTPEGIAEQITSLPGSFSDVRVADIDKDGDADLVAVGFSTFRVALGDGTGHFGEWTHYSFSTAPANLADGNIQLGDLNGDSYVDVVASTPDAAYTYLNSGDGFFEFSTVLTFPQRTRIRALTDANRDGLPDLVGNLDVNGFEIGSVNSTIVAWQGHSDGSFIELLQAHFSNGRVGSMQSADVNGDGVEDLITTHSPVFHAGGRHGISVHLGNSDGGWHIPQLVSTSPSSRVQLADIDRDGSQEITSLHEDQISVRNLQPPVIFDTKITDVTPTDAFQVDLDGDGLKERIQYNATSSKLEVFAAQGVEPRQTIALSEKPDTYLAADMNLDGIKDLVLLSEKSTQKQIATLFVDATGELSTPVVTLRDSLSTAAHLVDLNSDQIPDLIEQTGKFRISAGSIDGSFSSSPVVSVPGFESRELSFVDFNNDTFPEIVLTTGSITEVYSRQQDGAYLELNMGPGQKDFADFNGDGNVDMAASIGGALFVGLGTGRLTFNLQLIGEPATGLLAVDDFNGDGIADLATANGSQNSIFYGSSTGLSLQTTYEGWGWAAELLAADFSGDGLTDYVAYSTSTGSLFAGAPSPVGLFSLAIGGPSGEVFEVIQYTTSAFRRIAATDQNSDGKIDLEFEITSPFSLIPQITGTLANISSASPIGDFDQDGQLDANDIDLLCRQIGAEDNDKFDLNEDSNVDDADVAYMVETIMATELGDTNLDGHVAFDDFLPLAANFGLINASWSQGDFDCDGTIGFSDFLILASNFGN